MKQIIISYFLLVSSIGLSCTCGDLTKKPVLEYLNLTEQIFEGTITSIKLEGKFKMTAEFEVTNGIKGVNTKTIMIETDQMSSMCGSDFKLGDKWLIFASSNYTGKCNGNIRLDTYSLNDIPISKIPEQYQFYFTKLQRFITDLTILTTEEEFIEYDENNNIIAKGKIGLDKLPIGKWYYADLKKNNSKADKN